MEPAKIDWKNVQWVFVEDELYEHINAPKWFDFSAPQEDDPADTDVAWFCRPGRNFCLHSLPSFSLYIHTFIHDYRHVLSCFDLESRELLFIFVFVVCLWRPPGPSADCNHPTTAEDFLNSTPKSSSNKKSANAYKTLLLGDRNQRDLSTRRRGLAHSPTQSSNCVHRSEDSENQNPNLSTPVNQHIRSLKAAIKSSSEKKKPFDEPPRANEAPRLKSTLSARNLFAGRNILNHITEFVGELKKLALRAREREENVEKLNVENDRADLEEGTAELLLEGMTGEEKEKEKERKPLLEVGKGRSDGSELSISKEKQRRVVEAENIPISLDMENVRPKGENILSQIRTSPPTPQCFSSTSRTTKKTLPKETRSRLMERQILKEVKQTSEEAADKGRSSNFGGKEAKVLDLFWILKPCTPSS
ncbi:hypothetical protein CRG98_047949 [Punica granatum]|uniref:Uncharacterized protein n=1 Tax=Punica granatum TaxID=22663 RepID=A0A2I0HIZ1_PUNGR|nr:hypothetical protein CRG98_047949 [Punica granatum]